MHAILIAIGSAGDVFPFIGLARTLKLRGHRVSLCTIPVFRDAVEQHGIAFVPLSDELTYRRAMGDPRLWDPKTSFGVLWQTIAGMIEPVYEYVSAQRHDDIVVVGSLWALGARIAHEKYGIPYLSAQVSPSTFAVGAPAAGTPQVQRARADAAGDAQAALALHRALSWIAPARR